MGFNRRAKFISRIDGAMVGEMGFNRRAKFISRIDGAMVGEMNFTQPSGLGLVCLVHNLRKLGQPCFLSF